MGTHVTSRSSVTEGLRPTVLREGYAFATGAELRAELDPSGVHWPTFEAHWEGLDEDPYLKGDYVFRHRRYGLVGYTPRTGVSRMLENTTFYQSSEINGYAGGIQRTFAALEPDFVAHPLFQALMHSSFAAYGVEDEYLDAEWQADVNLFRLKVEEARVTEPTPEGIHRDGVPFGTVHVVHRHRVEGGISHVYTMDEELLDVKMLTGGLDTLYAFDNRVKHYATPLFAHGMSEGYRDTLVYGFFLPGTKYRKA